MDSSHESLNSKSRRTCSIGRFMSAAGKRNGLTHSTGSTFELFRYRTGREKLIISSSTGTPQRSICDKLVIFSERLSCGSPNLLQVWVPIKSKNGKTMLSISEQPFSVGGLYNGLCRYRNHCVEREYHSYSEIGPPGRVFEQGFPEYCQDIKCYSKCEFPTRDYAISCGIVSYWALPLFESGQCVGVLEYFTMESRTNSSHVLPPHHALKALKIACPSTPLHECDKIRDDVLYPRLDIKNVLKFVSKAHKLPLIQLWVPCMCDDSNSVFTLFRDMRVCSEDLRCFSDFENLIATYRTCFVKNGQSLVGEAHSVNRPCFCRDTSQFFLSDYPFVHFTRSSGLAACFVIPLEFVHPSLDALFLEIFLPPEHEYSDGNPKAMLESLLPTLAQGFSKLNFAVGLKLNEQFWVEGIHSDTEKFEYFNVNRRSNANAKEVITTMAEDPTTLDVLEHPNARDTPVSSMDLIAAVAAEDLNTWFTLSPFSNVQDTTSSYLEDQMALDVLRPSTNAQDTSHSSRGVAATVAENPTTLNEPEQLPDARDTILVEDPITFDVLKQYFGNPLDVVAEALGVGKSTLKRRCRAVGIKPWPAHKRHRVGQIQSNSQLQNSQPDNNAAEEVAPPFQTDNNNAAPSGDRIRQSYDMIVKATYKDDTIMFTLGSSSGIEELRGEMAKRFKVEVEKFKIKYKYEDDWILITGDEDLRLGLNMLKSTRKTTMNLSIFPLATS